MDSATNPTLCRAAIAVRVLCTMDYATNPRLCRAAIAVRVLCTMGSATNPRLCRAIAVRVLCTMDSATNPRLCRAAIAVRVLIQSYLEQETADISKTRSQTRLHRVKPQPSVQFDHLQCCGWAWLHLGSGLVLRVGLKV
jgi:hypothetical protein